MARAALLPVLLCKAVAADHGACTMSKDDYPVYPQDNCTQGAQPRCCPDSGWDFSSNYSRWAGHCYDNATEACVTPQPHCSPCVSVPCVKICAAPATYNCRGTCMDPTKEECCGGTVCETAAKGESCARANFCDGGVCCASGSTPCESTAYGGSGVCCGAAEKCQQDGAGQAECVPAQ